MLSPEVKSAIGGTQSLDASPSHSVPAEFFFFLPRTAQVAPGQFSLMLSTVTPSPPL